MKITFEHLFGKQTNSDIRHIIVNAEIEPTEHKEALESGWLFDTDWYQTRSVRLDLEKYVAKRKWPTHLKFKMGTINDFDKDAISQIYNDYITHKGYSDLNIPILSDILGPALFGVIYDTDIPVAFTKFTKYNDALESTIFCWNYHTPKLSLGKIIQDKEVEYAKSLGLQYLYIGQGYETTCIYKAKIPGFEWWTGSNWSTDTEKYIQLCESDNAINTISELHTMIKRS